MSDPKIDAQDEADRPNETVDTDASGDENAGDEEKARLDEVERTIDDARKQAEQHGTLTPDKPEPDYIAQDPVGIPDPVPDDEQRPDSH